MDVKLSNLISLSDFELVKKLDNIQESIPEWMKTISNFNEHLAFVYKINKNYLYIYEDGAKGVRKLIEPLNEELKTGFYYLTNGAHIWSLTLFEEINDEKDVSSVPILIPPTWTNTLGDNIKTTNDLLDLVKKSKCIKISFFGDGEDDLFDAIGETLGRLGYTGNDDVFTNGIERYAMYRDGVNKTNYFLIYGTPEDKYYDYLDDNRYIILKDKDNLIFTIDRTMDYSIFSRNYSVNKMSEDIVESMRKNIENIDRYCNRWRLEEVIKEDFDRFCSRPSEFTKLLNSMKVCNINESKDIPQNITVIKKIYLFEIEYLKQLSMTNVENYLKEVLKNANEDMYIGKLRTISDSNSRIDLASGVSFQGNQYLFPEAYLTISKNGKPLNYKDIVQISKTILLSYRITDLMNDLEDVMYERDNNIKIQVKNNVSNETYTIHITHQERGFYINEYRINKSEILKVLERIPCTGTQNEFDAFVKSVSRLSLKLHDIVVNGLNLKNVKMLFFIKKEKGKWYVKSGIDSWEYLKGGYSDFGRIQFTKDYQTILFENKSTSEVISVVRKLSSVYPSIPLDSVIEIAKHGYKEYATIEERAKKLLEDSMESLKDHIVLRTEQYIIIKGLSGKHYKVELDELKVYNSDEQGNIKDYICIADAQSDAVHLDRFVTRLYVLANDSLMNKEVSTLRA